MTQVSIIVPIYNPPEQYLRECLDSICNQTLKDIEIILVDNASTGNNPAIIKEYQQKDQRIKILALNKNIGYSGACAKGLALAAGQYIHFMDSDDILKENIYEVCLKQLTKHNSDIAICTHFEIFNTSCQKITNTVVLQDTLDEEHSLHPEMIKQQIFNLGSQLWNKIFKKDFLKQNHITVSTKLKTICSDSLFCFKCLAHNPQISIIDQSLYIYREGVATGVVKTVFSDPQKSFDIITFYKEIYKYFKKHNPCLLPYLVQRNLHNAQNYLLQIPKKNKKNFIKELYNLYKNEKSLDTTSGSTEVSFYQKITHLYKLQKQKSYIRILRFFSTGKTRKRYKQKYKSLKKQINDLKRTLGA